MKNKLSDLNNYLFEALERLTDDSLSDEALQREINRSEAMTSVAETIIHSGELTLKAAKVSMDYGFDGNVIKLPALLEMSEGK